MVKCEGCGRSINPEVRLCPYCNFQRQTAETLGERRENTIVSTVTAPRPEKRTRRDREWVRKLVVGIGAVALMVGVFLVGAFVRSLGVEPPEVEEEPAEQIEGPQIASNSPATDLNLISDPSAAAIGRSYTSRSPIDVDLTDDDQLQRSDATALPESVYQNVAREEEAREAERYEAVDPRDVTDSIRPRRRLREEPASPPDQPSQENAVSQATSSDTSVRTSPRPLSQNVPPIRTREQGVIRLQLTISPEGRVTDVRVLQSLADVTQDVVDAARSWTFSPATENGRPVQGTYQVAIRVNQ